MPQVAFERYLRERAETWERLAWSRSRTIAGSAPLASRIEEAVADFVYGPWDERIPSVMGDIRRRMERELAQAGGRHLEFKVGRGGLVDIDFAAQMIQIREGAARHELRRAGTRALLSRLSGTAFLPDGELAELRAAYSFLRRLETFARMDADSDLSALPPEPERLEAVGKRMGLSASGEDSLTPRYERVTARVREIYEAVLARLTESGGRVGGGATKGRGRSGADRGRKGARSGRGGRR
jgi:glutamate-ammonia-ligase adenylyltransferase